MTSATWKSHSADLDSVGIGERLMLIFTGMKAVIPCVIT